MAISVTVFHFTISNLISKSETLTNPETLFVKAVCLSPPCFAPKPNCEGPLYTTWRTVCFLVAFFYVKTLFYVYCLFSVFVYVCAHVCMALRTTCRDSNLGLQAWQQALLFTKPSPWPQFLIFYACHFIWQWKYFIPSPMAPFPSSATLPPARCNMDLSHPVQAGGSQVWRQFRLLFLALGNQRLPTSWPSS